MKKNEIKIKINTNTSNGYKKFIKCKKLPKYFVKNNIIYTDKESYNFVFSGKSDKKLTCNNSDLFDYQEYITNIALNNKRYAVFADCGIGKTRIELKFADTINKKVLYLCPLSVMDDIQLEAERMNISISNLRKSKWVEKIGLINFENMKKIDMRGVSGIILDESSILKNGDGKIRKYLTDLSSSVEYRLCCSATPSPNEHSEYATHAVFLGYASTTKEFYSRFFRKDGTNWIIKSHAIDPFYNHLSSWASYIKSPSKIGFEQGAEMIEEPNYILLESGDNNYGLENQLFPVKIGLQESNKLIFGELRSDPDTNRFKMSLNAIKGKQSIIWCSRNNEEQLFHKALNGSSVLITGSTPIEKRVDLINDFRKGNIQHLISKPSILGFGVNIPQADAMLYSGYNYSFEQFYQAVRRSHRFGRKNRLDVYIPVSNIERPVWNLLQKKLKSFDKDVLELQSRIFKKNQGGIKID